MKSRIYILMLPLAALFATGCEKEEISYYDSTHNGVRFDNRNISYSGGFTTSREEGYFRSESFIQNMDAEYMDVDMELVVTGYPVSYDRTVGYRIDTTTTAPDGSYEILASMIPANESKGYIRVRIQNREELQEKDYSLVLTLTDGGDLPPSSKLVADARGTLTWSAQIPFPTVSNYVRTYNLLILGVSSGVSTSTQVLSSNAMMAIVNALDWDDWDDQEIHGSSYNRDGYPYLPKYSLIYTNNQYLAYQAKLAEWLDDYEVKHGERLLHNGGAKAGDPITVRKGAATDKY